MTHTDVMNTTQITKVNPVFHTHEGYTFLEWEGEFYKGCKRCGGAGHYSFNGEHSLCYTCYNTPELLGDHLGTREDAEQWCHGKAVAQARRDKARKDKHDRLVRKFHAYQQALKIAAPDVYDFLMTVVIEEDTQDQYDTYEGWAVTQQGTQSTLEKNSFIRSMAETFRWVGPSRLFSDNMINAVRKAMTQRTEQAAEAAAHPAPEGRVAVTGEISSAKMVEGDYGTAYKILLKDDAGFKVWVSLPKAQADEAYDVFYEAVEANGYSLHDFGPACWFLGTNDSDKRFSGIKGKRITFTATLTPSQDDPSFAFGSRPTKGSWL